MAITEITLETYVEELQPCLKNIYELEDKMVEGKEGIDSIIAKLTDEDFDIIAWVGDHLSHTDNPERKAEAIKLLKELKNELSGTTIDLNILKHDIQDELNSLLMEFQDWRKYFKNTLPLISLSIVMPPYKTANIDKGIAFILFVANQCFGKIKVLDSLIRKLGALAALAAVLYLVAGIIQGEMRKKYFENIQAETNQAKKDLSETRQQIDIVQNQVNAFFKDVTKAVQATGLLQVIYTNHRELVFLVKEQSNVLRRWSDQFNAMKRMSERGMELATAAGIAAEVLCKNPADHNELQKTATILLGSYLIENEATVTEVANKLRVSVEQAKKVKAIYLLFNKHTPAEIAEALDMEVQEVEFIEEANKEVLASVA